MTIDTRDPVALRRAVAFLDGVENMIDVAEAHDNQSMKQDRRDVALLRALCGERLAEIERGPGADADDAIARIRKLIERNEELERRLDESRAGAARFVQQIEELERERKTESALHLVWQHHERVRVLKAEARTEELEQQNELLREDHERLVRDLTRLDGLLERHRMTDEEREAVEGSFGWMAKTAHALRAYLKRTEGEP